MIFILFFKQTNNILSLSLMAIDTITRTPTTSMYPKTGRTWLFWPAPRKSFERRYPSSVWKQVCYLNVAPRIDYEFHAGSTISLCVSSRSVMLALLLTNGMPIVRIPLRFKSKLDGHTFRHIVLAIFFEVCSVCQSAICVCV